MRNPEKSIILEVGKTRTGSNRELPEMIPSASVIRLEYAKELDAKTHVHVARSLNARIAVAA